MDNFTGGPDHFLLVSFTLGLFLLFKHLVQDRNDPVFELAVVIVWDDEIADAVEAFGAELGTRSGK